MATKDGAASQQQGRFIHQPEMKAGKQAALLSPGNFVSGTFQKVPTTMGGQGGYVCLQLILPRNALFNRCIS